MVTSCLCRNGYSILRSRICTLLEVSIIPNSLLHEKLAHFKSQCPFDVALEFAEFSKRWGQGGVWNVNDRTNKGKTSLAKSSF